MKKFLLFIVTAIVLTSQLNGITESEYKRKKEKFKEKQKQIKRDKEEIKDTFSYEDIQKIVKEYALGPLPEKVSFNSYREGEVYFEDYLKIKTKEDIQNILPGKDISVFGSDISCAIQDVTKEILEISYKKLSDTELSELDDFHKALQFCSKKYSSKKYPYRPDYFKKQDCLEILGMPNAQSYIFDFERAGIKQDYFEYKNKHRPSLFALFFRGAIKGLTTHLE